MTLIKMDQKNIGLFNTQLIQLLQLPCGPLQLLNKLSQSLEPSTLIAQQKWNLKQKRFQLRIQLFINLVLMKILCLALLTISIQVQLFGDYYLKIVQILMVDLNLTLLQLLFMVLLVVHLLIMLIQLGLLHKQLLETLKVQNLHGLVLHLLQLQLLY